MLHIEVIAPPEGNAWWKELTGLYLRENQGQEFAIHCWRDEEEALEQALRFGRIQPSDWAYGTCVTGKVTEDFAQALLAGAQFQREGPDSSAQMTPFFNVFLGSSFSSSHYGRELDVEELSGPAWDTLMENLSQKDWLTLYAIPERDRL